jgi:hypothetical protein
MDRTAVAGNNSCISAWRQAGRHLRQVSHGWRIGSAAAVPFSPSPSQTELLSNRRTEDVVDGVESDVVVAERPGDAVDSVLDTVVNMVANAVIYICVMKLKKLVW